MPVKLVAAARAGLTALAFLIVISKRPASAQGFTPHHAYVADAGAHAVFRFKLNADGLPETHPDSLLRGGLTAPSYVAFDRAGELFVSDAAGFVDVYAPGASGNTRPIRVLTLRGDGAGPVAVSETNLFIVDTTTNVVDIFPIGASGEANPLSTIQNWQLPISGLAVDQAGSLFVVQPLDDALRYDDPLRAHDEPSEVLSGQSDIEDVVADSIAVSRDGSLIYLPFITRRTAPFGRLDFAIRAVNRPPSVSYDPMIFTHDCATDGSAGEAAGLAVSGRYLLVSCLYGGIDVYDRTLLGEQNAIETFGRHIFSDSLGIAVGP